MSKRKTKTQGASLRNQIKNALRQNGPLTENDIEFLSSTLGVAFSGNNAPLADSLCREIFASGHSGSKDRLLQFGDMLIGQAIQANPDEPWATFTAHFIAAIPEGCALLRLDPLDELEKALTEQCGFEVKVLPEVVWSSIYCAQPLSAARLAGHSLAKAKKFNVAPETAARLENAVANTVAANAERSHQRCFGLDICAKADNDSFDPDIAKAKLASALEQAGSVKAAFSDKEGRKAEAELQYVAIGEPCSSVRDWAHFGESQAFEAALARALEKFKGDRSQFSADILSASQSPDKQTMTFAAVIKGTDGTAIETVLCGPTSDAGLLFQDLAQAASNAFEETPDFAEPAQAAQVAEEPQAQA